MMEDNFKTLEKPAEGMFRDRNSRFLAFGYPVENLEQVNSILLAVRKKYHDARHHCYAFVLGYNKEVYRMNDDGEPSGTAGKPIYNQITANDLTNILIVVVRYFGGTLLGTGGLINAYRSSAADMLGRASVIIKYIEQHYHLSFSYEMTGPVMRVLKEENLVPRRPLYDAQCSLEVVIRKSMAEKF